jgi:hypothetical protein
MSLCVLDPRPRLSKPERRSTRHQLAHRVEPALSLRKPMPSSLSADRPPSSRERPALDVGERRPLEGVPPPVLIPDEAQPSSIWHSLRRGSGSSISVGTGVGVGRSAWRALAIRDRPSHRRQRQRPRNLVPASGTTARVRAPGYRRGRPARPWSQGKITATTTSCRRTSHARHQVGASAITGPTDTERSGGSGRPLEHHRVVGPGQNPQLRARDLLDALRTLRDAPALRCR